MDGHGTKRIAWRSEIPKEILLEIVSGWLRSCPSSDPVKAVRRQERKAKTPEEVDDEEDNPFGVLAPNPFYQPVEHRMMDE